MRYQNVCLEAVVCVLPETVVTSAAIEERLQPLYERLKLPEGRLELISGIRERRIWLPGTRPSQVAAAAGRQALDKAGMAPEQIGAVFHCSVCRDFMEPATATVVHQLLGLPAGALNFDISNACLGVMSGMVVLANLIESGQVEAGMVVSGENSRALMEGTINELLTNTSLTRQQIKGHFASLTIGSAAAAVVLTHRSASRTGHRLLGGGHWSNTRFNTLCQGGSEGGAPAGELQMQTDSELLLREGIAVAARTWENARQNLGWNNATANLYCCHQVGRTHRDLLFQTLGLDPAKDFSTFETLGNCGSASWPATLAIAEAEGRLQPGMNIGLLGIGSGINSMMLGVEW